MGNNRYTATIVLGFTAAGFAASYPFNATFLGGLLNSAFLAGTVGGLADWFAVEALFRKPLGIPFRTEVIPKNKDRIIGDMKEFVEQELLTTENILRTLRREENRASKMVIAYLNDHEGKEHCKALAGEIIGDIGRRLEGRDVIQLMRNFLVDNASRVRLAPKVIAALEWSMKHGYEDKVADFVISQLGKLIDSKMFRKQLSSFVATVKRRYNGDSAWRDFWVDFEPDDAAGELQNRAAAFIAEPNDGYRLLRTFLKNVIRDRLAEFKENSEQQAVVEAKAAEFIRSWDPAGAAGGDGGGAAAGFRRLLAQFVPSGGAPPAGESGSAGLARILAGEGPGDIADAAAAFVGEIIDEKTAEFAGSAEWQAAFDGWAERQLEKLLQKYQGDAGEMVEAEMKKYDNATLVELVEKNVGNDLQIIRINGTMIGGIAGMALYLISYGVERLYG